MNYWLILIPLISAFIGWFTNWIAIKMLFHPKEPKKILGITFHGIFPKRQQQFAEKLGKLVSEELLSFKEIAEEIDELVEKNKMEHVYFKGALKFDNYTRFMAIGSYNG